MKNMYLLTILLLVAVLYTHAQTKIFNFTGSNKSSNRELLIFYSANCEHCIKASKAINDDAGFRKKMTDRYNIRPFDIGTAEGKQAAAKLGITATPTFVQFKADHSYTIINGFTGTDAMGSILFADNASATAQLVPPTNDECANAISLTGTSGSVNGDNTEATNSALGNFLCQANWQKDVWYKFTLASPAFVNLMVNAGTMTDPVLSLYSGSTCSSQFFQIDCNDDGGTNNNSALAKQLTAGNYWLRVGGYYTNAGIGSFTVVYNLSTGCANGILENGEQCDDGNLSNGDGCTSTCTFENSSSVKGIGINEDATPPNPSAILDVKSSTKGMLVPRVTTAQRTAITQPAKGLLVFDVTTNSFWYYRTSWKEMVDNPRIGFYAYRETDIPNLDTTLVPILDQEAYDDGNNFTNNIFTAPEDGVYSFVATTQWHLSGSNNRNYYLLIEDENGSTLGGTTWHTVAANFMPIYLSAAAEVKLTAGDKVRLKIGMAANSDPVDVQRVTLTGHKVY